MIRQRLLEILVCPACKGELEYVTEPDEELHCKACRLAYPVKDDIPDMIIEDARKLDAPEAGDSSGPQPDDGAPD